MKLACWNVNGIRSILTKGFLNYVSDENPDILCLQETKAHPEQVDLVLPSYAHFWNSAQKKGYSGTAIFSKKEAVSFSYGMGIEKHDLEGRVITLEFDSYFLVDVYTPNSKRELERLDYRMEWDRDFLKFLKKLEKKKPVILCGDLNVAHKEIDLANPKTNRRNAGFTDEEREGFNNLVEAGFIDSFRHFNQGSGHYTWWSYFANSRARNIGWRIDYFCVSQALASHMKAAGIRPKVMGSDHCPVFLEVKGL